MKNLFTFLAAILIANILQAQITFEKTYGGVQADIGTCGLQTFSGGYVFVGNSSSFGSGSYFIIADEFGNEISSKTYFNIADGMQPSVAQLKDSSFILVGSDGSQIVVIKIKEDGSDSLWSKVVDGATYVSGNFRISVTATADGGFAVGSYDFTGNNYIGFIAKYKPDGTQEWNKTYAPADNAMAMGLSITQTSDNGFLLVGVTDNKDFYVVKTSNSGVELWNRALNISIDDLGWSGVEDTDGNFIVVGATIVPGKVGYDMLIMKLDASTGDTIWTKTYGGDKGDEAWYINKVNDGGFIVTGGTETETNGYDLFFLRLDASCDSMWETTYGGTQEETGRFVQQTKDNGFIAVGATKSKGAGDNDFYVLKVDDAGILSVPFLGKNIQKLNIYPNPMDNKTTIYFNNDTKSNYQLKITDLTGKTVRLVNDIKDNRFDIYKQDLNSGIYVVELKGKNIYRNKLIVR